MCKFQIRQLLFIVGLVLATQNVGAPRLQAFFPVLGRALAGGFAARTAISRGGFSRAFAKQATKLQGLRARFQATFPRSLKPSKFRINTGLAGKSRKVNVRVSMVDRKNPRISKFSKARLDLIAKQRGLNVFNKNGKLSAKGFDIHHIIPRKTGIGDHAVMKHLSKTGKGLNSRGLNSHSNLVVLPSHRAPKTGFFGNRTVHKGPHNAYSNEVKIRLNSIQKNFHKNDWAAQVSALQAQIRAALKAGSIKF